MSKANETLKTQTDQGMAMVNALSEMQQAGLAPMAYMGRAWADAVGEMGAEMAQFIADRIKTDVAMQHRMMHAKTLDELQRLQTEFVKTAVADYSAESGKLTEIGQAAMERLQENK